MVRLLEQRLGFALFRRHANALALTAQGVALLSGLTDSFDSVARLADQVAAMRARPVLTIGVGPATATDAGITLANGAVPKEPAPRVKVADPSTD
jgi:LysR family transcriptional regulator of beta-lactamase